jgi:DNA-binding NarL/FixJ family response regulator
MRGLSGQLDGISATRTVLAHAGHAPRVLVVTTGDIDEYVYEALRAGASGFLLKNAPPEELVRAVRVVAAGESLLAPRVTTRLIEEFCRQPAPSACWHADSRMVRSPTASSSAAAP